MQQQCQQNHELRDTFVWLVVTVTECFRLYHRCNKWQENVENCLKCDAFCERNKKRKNNGKQKVGNIFLFNMLTKVIALDAGFSYLPNYLIIWKPVTVY